MKYREVKIKAFTIATIPADENEYFMVDAIDSIIMNTKPEDWIYEDIEVIGELEKEHEE